MGVLLENNPSLEPLPASHSADGKCCRLLTTAVRRPMPSISNSRPYEALTPEHPVRVATKNSAQQANTKGRMQMTFHERYLGGCAALALAPLLPASPTHAQAPTQPQDAALNAEAAQNDWPTHHGTYKS